MEPIGIQYLLEEKGGAVWTLAIHDGHRLSSSLAHLINLSPEERLREEDPYTGILTDIGTNRLIIETSRFQLDINRPIEDAIYLHPDQAWGLQVWKHLPTDNIVNALHKTYYYIQKLISFCLEETIRQYGYFIILDIHSYNAKRAGREEIIDVDRNPQLNVGTIHNRHIWRPFIDAAITFMKTKSIDNQRIDIRENVKFTGGHLSQWINERYGKSGCVLSLEFRKDFMDEWTGVPEASKIEELRLLLRELLPFINKKTKDLPWIK